MAKTKELNTELLQEIFIVPSNKLKTETELTEEAICTGACRSGACNTIEK